MTIKSERLNLETKGKLSKILANEMLRNGGQYVPIKRLRQLVEKHDVQKQNKEK